MESGLTGGGNRGQGPAVEGPGQRNDLKPPLTAVFTGQFYRSFIGLCPAVPEEDRVRKGMSDQKLGQLCLGLGMKEI